MGQGLGRNSPVLLSFGRENYEALIERHGQWVRWRAAAKCPCANEGTGQPDLHCKRCGGRGFTYSVQRERTVTQTVMAADESGIIELDGEFVDCPLLQVYDNSGRGYPNAVKRGRFVILNGAPTEKGVYVTAVMTQKIVRGLESAACEKVAEGFYRVEGLRVRRTAIDGLFHDAPCDILKIGRIVDADGVEFETEGGMGLRQDCFFLRRKTEAVETVDEEMGGVVGTEEREVFPKEPLRAFDVEYVEPFVFALLRQELSEADLGAMSLNGGEAELIFPYNCDVAQHDIVTMLSGTYTQKEVVARRGAEFDVLKAYFVEGVVSCVGRAREFKAGVDFVLLGTNYLKWLCDDAPEEGEAYSVAYRVFPTYEVAKEIPRLRTAENQRLPKRAAVRLFDTYSERRGVNRQ